MVTESTGPRALTMRPPWGYAIARLGKDVENRSWGTTYRGAIYIHQGHTFSEQGMHDRRVRTAYSALVDTDVEVMPYDVLDQGFILGRATLVDCHRIGPNDTCCGVWADRYHPDYDPEGSARDRMVHWRLENVQALAEPVRASGGQGLWYLRQDIADMVDEQLRTQQRQPRPPAAPRRSPVDVTADRLRRHIESGELSQAEMVLAADLLDRLETR